MSNNRAYQISDTAQKIYELAKAGDNSALQQFIPTCADEFKSYAIKMLAKDNNMPAIERLSKLFNVDEEDVILGLAMGGHAQAIREYPSKPRGWVILEFEGYALGRQIEKVNDYLSTGNNDVLIGNAAIFYELAGHTQNIDDTLELITLTSSRDLRKCLAHSLEKNVPSVNSEVLLARAEKLSMIMQQQKIDYRCALAVLTDVEMLPKTIKSDSYHDSVRLFSQAAAAKLSFYQKRAVEQLQKVGISEYLMLNWKPHAHDLHFSYNHLQALRFLLEEQKVQALQPSDAIKEIDRLNVYQVTALIELYTLGLRGSHLREWQRRADYLVFSEKELETLLTVTRDKKKQPVEALNDLSGVLPVNQAVRKYW